MADAKKAISALNELMTTESTPPTGGAAWARPLREENTSSRGADPIDHTAALLHRLTRGSAVITALP